jgi:hypothetical protein
MTRITVSLVAIHHNSHGEWTAAIPDEMGGSIANNVVKKQGEKSDSFEFPSLAKRGEGRFYE